MILNVFFLQSILKFQNCDSPFTVTMEEGLPSGFLDALASSLRSFCGERLMFRDCIQFTGNLFLTIDHNKSFHFDFLLNPDFWKISAPIQNRQAWQSSGREVALADSEEACGGFGLPQAILLVGGECPLTAAHIPTVGFSKPVIWKGKDWQLFI